MGAVPLDLLMPFVSATEKVFREQQLPLQRAAIQTCTGPIESSAESVVCGMGGALSGFLFLGLSRSLTVDLSALAWAAVLESQTRLAPTRYRFAPATPIVVRGAGQLIHSGTRHQAVHFRTGDAALILRVVLHPAAPA